MFLEIVIGIILGITVVIIYMRIKIQRMVEMAKNFPGPKPLPIIGNALDFGSTLKEQFDTVVQFEKKYGSFYGFWIGPKLVVQIADPVHIEVVLSSNKILDKSWTYKYLLSWLGTGLITGSGQKWKSHRKLVTRTFHFKILEQFVDVFNSNVDVLISRLKEHVNGDEFNISPHVTLCALDNICETAMGVSVNAQKDSESEYVKASGRACGLALQRSLRPWYHPDVIFNLSPFGRLYNKYVSILRKTTMNVVKLRKRELLGGKKGDITPSSDVDDIGRKKKVAFLDLLLQSSIENGGILTDEDIQEEVDTIMFAGHDTSSSSIDISCWALGKYPHAQEKVVAELKSVFGDSDRLPTYQDLQELKYMEMFIKEVLRLYPSVPTIAREISEDISLGEYTVPAGANILIVPFVTHRNPNYFPDPEKFDPDRFLPENSVHRNPYSYIPFSAGPRNCIGQKFGMIELKTTLCQLLRTFKFLPSETPLCLTNEIILKSSTGVNVKLQLR